jgi:hypothetical protein
MTPRLQRFLRRLRAPSAAQLRQMQPKVIVIMEFGYNA